jgi:hypothetical protein
VLWFGHPALSFHFQVLVMKTGYSTCRVALLFLLWVAGAAQAEAVPAATSLRTEHYDLTVEENPLVAAEVGELCEALYAELKQFFKAEPRERLNVQIFATRQGYLAALPPNVRRINPNCEGQYRSSTKCVYLPCGFGPGDTRWIIRHECTHQFHSLARTENLGPSSAYYAEGLAEHFAIPRPNGGLAANAAIPVIAMRDCPGEALQDFDTRHRGSFHALATDPTAPTFEPGTFYGAAWGLVSFLVSEHPQEYSTWSASLDSRAEPGSVFDNAFHRFTDEVLSREYRQWLEKRQERWFVPNAGDWENKDNALRAISPDIGLTMALSKDKSGSLSASVSTASDKVAAGVVFDYTSLDHYEVVQVFSEGIIGIWGYTDKKYVMIGKADTLARSARKFDISVVKSGRSVKIYVDGIQVAERKVSEESKVGLLVEHGAAVFSHVKPL